MSWRTAALYDRMMRGVEEAGLQRWRAELLLSLECAVLEIGAGTGVNLPHYPATVRRLVHAEPDPHMRRHLSRRLGTARCPVEVLPVPLEALTLPPESFDAVVATLVFCSVPDQAAALGHVRALLRPGNHRVFVGLLQNLLKMPEGFIGQRAGS